MDKDRFVWIDLETTGLNPETCHILEVAMIITDHNLETLDKYESVVWQPASILETMEPFVRAMHEHNGLLGTQPELKSSLYGIQRKMIRILNKHVEFGRGILAGSSIHFDRAFLQKYMPIFTDQLHHRMLDTSSFKVALSNWRHELLPPKREQQKAHRAFIDIQWSIEDMKHYKSIFGPSIAASP